VFLASPMVSGLPLAPRKPSNPAGLDAGPVVHRDETASAQNRFRARGWARQELSGLAAWLGGAWSRPIGRRARDPRSIAAPPRRCICPSEPLQPRLWPRPCPALTCFSARGAVPGEDRWRAACARYRAACPSASLVGGAFSRDRGRPPRQAPAQTSCCRAITDGGRARSLRRTRSAGAPSLAVGQPSALGLALGWGRRLCRRPLRRRGLDLALAALLPFDAASQGIHQADHVGGARGGVFHLVG